MLYGPAPSATTLQSVQPLDFRVPALKQGCVHTHCLGSLAGIISAGYFFGRFSNPGPGCFFSWDQHEDKGKLQKRRALPEGRAKFCTLTRRREVQNGMAQYSNRVPQLSHPAGEHTPHYQKVVTLVY